MDEVKGIRIVSLTGEKEYGIEDSEAREELANVVDGAPEELDSFKEAFEKFKEGGEALAGIAADVAAVGKAVTDEAARAQAAEQVLEEKLDSLSQGGGGGVAELMEEVTYSELVALRDNARLVAGMKYRITDYVTTTVQQGTKSANHPFDVIVEAVSENELSELAQAIQHEGDTYFEGNDLGAWQLWYDLDNNTDKYEWADAENGKGVIYRMIDEKRNDCPYDFKNILFYNNKYTSSTTSDRYYYTFSYVVEKVLYDGSVEKRVTKCYSNSMEVFYTNKKSLNKNTFLNSLFGYNCYSNTFGYNCHSNTFGYNCHSNTFGYNCSSNTFGDNCYSNTFGYNCYSNTFGNYCHSNTFGYNCYSNTFGNYCHSNTFGDNCYSNTFGYNCHSNTFGDNCSSNTFGDICHSNTFGDICHSNTFGYNCHSNTFRNGCAYNTFGDAMGYRQINRDKTSITLNEEYYDDGTNALVPIKHPDLSTRPSILPYKFMGQYVYEQLIPIIHDEVSNGPTPNSIPMYNKNLGVEHSKIIFMEAQLIGRNSCISARVIWYDAELKYLVFIVNVGNNLVDIIGYDYVRLVYTSMPTEEGGYYGYNNY